MLSCFFINLNKDCFPFSGERVDEVDELEEQETSQPQAQDEAGTFFSIMLTRTFSMAQNFFRTQAAAGHQELHGAGRAVGHGAADGKVCSFPSNYVLTMLRC